jgi:hypothetical protein
MAGEDKQDLHPNSVNIYGWVVLMKDNDTDVWHCGQDEKYKGLPEHHEFLEVAQDQANHLRKMGITCRVCGLTQEPDYDKPKEATNE